MSQTQLFKINVVGHEWAIDLFQRQVEADRTPQSLLITGPLNVGKSTLARYLAQYLNCLSEANRPCGECRSCRKLISGNHPDIRVLDETHEALKIDQVRQLQHELALSPVETAYRVALLCNFERATAGAANALLKTLEEPAAQVVLILTAPDPGNLLPTIVSRCQNINLRPLPSVQLRAALEAIWQASPAQADLLTQLAAGRLGWAVRALTDEEFLTRRQQQLSDLQDLLRMHRAERLDYAAELSRDGAALRETLTLWLVVWRDLLLLQSGSQTKIINLDWLEPLQQIAGHTTLMEAGQMVAQLQTALLNIDRNVNPRLNLEVLLLKLPRPV